MCQITAIADLYGENTTTHYGRITFTQERCNAPVKVTGRLTGFNASTAHGFYVHTLPVEQTQPDCFTAAGHFNPYNTHHGPPTANVANRHVGDLGNITANVNGIAEVNFSDSVLQLYNGPQSIINRSIVIHLRPDVDGMGNQSGGHPSEHNIARLMCGRIVLSNNSYHQQISVYKLILLITTIITYAN